MRPSKVIVLFAVLSFELAFGEKTLKVSDLPPVVLKTVQEQLKGGEIKNISKETEKGVVQFEVESMLNGRHRDFNIDIKGNLIAVEEETSIDTMPGPAKDVVLKRVGEGKLKRVELVTQGGKTFYEASYVSKGGKKHEISVKPDGADAKE
jgi:uncharacterized membrane protein YkoI